MVKKVTKTASSRRFAYKSFRDHVDSIKIDPLKDIKRKAFHEVEVSHFLSTLEHWREVNLSKNFQELVDIVEPVTLSLPLLIYNKDKIFDALEKTVGLNETLSLQPSLELLSQFCHDLGPDFMEYYIRTLELIKTIALTQKDPQSLELIFNTLAYIFKYLSRVLANDLLPTFHSLLPLLTVEKKDYVTRFASEAISFLIRKAKLTCLKSFIDDVFNSPALLEDNSSSYHLALTVMFSESLKSAAGVLHSKAGIILPALITASLQNPKFTSVISDIIMELLDYTENIENSKLIYTTLFGVFFRALENPTYQQVTNITQLLLTLSFAESGRRVRDWNEIIKFVDLLYAAVVKLNETQDEDDPIKLNFSNSMVSWCAVLIRNADMVTLSKEHLNIIKAMSKLNNGAAFLAFIDAASGLNKDRTLQFAKNSVTSFITQNWKDNYKEIAYFLEKMNSKGLASELNIIIPTDFKSFILESFKNIKDIKNKNALINNYWRLIILQYCSIQFDPELLIKFLNLVQSCELTPDYFTLDVYGSTIGALTNQKLNDKQLLHILKLSIENFTILTESTIFLSNFEKLISKIQPTDSESLEFIQSSKNQLIMNLANVLKFPSHETRETALNLIISIFIKSGDDIPDAVSACRIIEQIPLTLQNARDVPLRFRHMAQDYSTESVLTNSIVTNFLFGQLSNKFSPSWQGVQEFTEKIFNQISDLLWSLCMEFISMDYKNLQEKPYLVYDFEDQFTEITDITNWLPQDKRLHTMMINFQDDIYHKYENVSHSIIGHTENLRRSNMPTDFTRYQVIKLLNKIPHLAEANFKDLLPFIINDDADDVNDARAGSLLDGWTMADRNGLIELMTHFKKLKKAPSIDKVVELLYILLMDRQVEIQKLALNCILNLNNDTYNRYQKHLKNLLDDTLFRDEVVMFLQNKEDSAIQNQDVPVLMPLVLRIIFGRAQTLKTNSTKVGRKVAAIKSLNSMNDSHITEFLNLTFCRFEFGSFEETGIVDSSTINRKLLKNINGFINMNLEVTETLGRNHRQCLDVLVKPLLYSLSVSEYAIENAESIEDSIVEKAARNGRKSGFKLLYQLMQYLGDDYDWRPYGDLIYNNLVESKMNKFGDENLSGASFLMKIMTRLWCVPSRLFFLYMDDFKPVKALLSILPNENAKDVVLVLILQFILALLNLPASDEKLVELLSIVISECLESLVLIFEHSSNSDVNSLAVQVLLSFVSNDYVTDNNNRKILLESLTMALDKPNTQIDMTVKIDIVRMIAILVEEYECSFDEIVPIYSNIAKLYSTCEKSDMRNVVSTVFYGVANRFNELENVCQMVIELNAYDSKRFREPDYDRRLQAFSILNESEYKNLSTIEWIPILYTCMFFINDENDQSLRSSAGYTFSRYVDGLNQKSESDAAEFIKQLKAMIIPTVRGGLKKKNELVRAEYVRVLNHIVKNIKYYKDLEDMKVLILYDDEDEESDFFEDIIHLQTYRRQKALRGLSTLAEKLTSSSIAHYILPIIEHYAFWSEDKYRNVANESINTIRKVAQFVSWNQFRAILNRYVSIMHTAKSKEQTEKLRDSILLIVSVSSAMRQWTAEIATKPSDYPTVEKINDFVCSDILPKLNKILSVKDENTVVIRVPISEAMIAFVMCCSQAKIDSELAGLLTSICQILRARSENLRDSVRKHLGRIAVSLGPHYLKFIIKELKGALTRGPQIHILSFTIHHILTIMSPYLEHGALGESVPMIMECIMNDIFGQASEEKEATGYSSKAKEIKHNKSFDTGELVSASIFLKDFNYLLTPVKYLLNERLSFKSQSKLEQLMQRFANGLNRNEEGSSTDILVLCSEVFNQATAIVESKKKTQNNRDEKVERFLVQLDARPQKTEVEYSLYVTTLQQFAFELLKTAISKHDNLFRATYMAPFVPMLQESLSSENEGVVISSLKVLTMLVRLDFEKEVDAKFIDAANDVLRILQDIPSTNNEICQNCLKFLSNVIRFKDDLELKNTAISYILKKVEPDLDSPERQATAFGFLKSITYKKIMIPEIYDCMDVVSKLMVTSTTNEIRQTARSTFYNFLMEYDQSRGRLEKQFKLIINNLKYPAYAGRLSVLELILTIVKKSSKDLLGSLTTSFFIALANVSVTDSYPSCRENASEILALMFKRLIESDMNISFVEKYTTAWLTQNKKTLLVRCGLNVYKIYASSVGYDSSEILDRLVFDRIERTLKLAKRIDEDEDESDGEDRAAVIESEWQMIYSCLIVFELLSEKTNVYKKKYEKIWNSVIDSLLYPHSWIRLSSSRLVNKLLTQAFQRSETDVEFKLDNSTIQTIAFRIFRQLGAPDISDKLAEQCVANLVFISKKWNEENTEFISFKKDQNNEDEIHRHRKEFTNAFDWALNRCAAILKNDSRDSADMIVTKKAVIKYFEFLTTFLGEEKLKIILSDSILVPLLHLSDQDLVDNENEEDALPTLAAACLETLSKKIGISEYNILLSSAMKTIQKRRQERKTRRAQLTLNNPEIAARRKLKKHFNVREKRKNNKDENGFYKAKRRRV